MTHHEDTAQMYQRITAAQAKTKNDAVTSIQVPIPWPDHEDIHNAPSVPDAASWPKHPDQWRTVDTPLAIQKYIQYRNQKHFGQGHGTPFTVSPLREYFYWQASTKEAELVLNGDFDSSDLSHLQQCLLNHCKKTSNTPDLPMEITETEFKKRFTKWSESTTTSPSGMDLGHYKVLFPPSNLPPTSDEGKLFEQRRQILINMHVRFINLLLKHRYSLSRWQQIVNVMIRKDADNSRISPVLI